MVLILSYIDDVNDKRRTQADQRNTAMLMAASRQKPQIILTDSTDLGQHIADLGDKIIDVLEAVKEDHSTKEQIDRINGMTAEFRELVETVQTSQETQADKIVLALNDLKTTVTKQKPVVVPAPAVSLQEKDVDLDPIVGAINDLKKLLAPTKQKKKTDLSTFRAHDQADAPDGMQYFGFMDLSGNWYIMQHDPEENRDRFYSGKESYDQAWDDKFGHTYTTLSEALRAL